MLDCRGQHVWLREVVFSAGQFSLVRRLIQASDGRSPKSQIIPKIGRISENKPQEVCKLVSTSL